MEWIYAVIYCLLPWLSICKGNRLHEILTYYDVIKMADFKHSIHRRSASQLYEKSIEFISHEQTFLMKLKQAKDVFATDFTAVTVDEMGMEKPVDVDVDGFYEGFVEDDPSSHVAAHLQNDGLITATIDTVNETYIIEPMWRHTGPNVSRDMIVYKASNVKSNVTHSRGSHVTDSLVARDQTRCGNNETADDEEIVDNMTRYRRSADNCKIATQEDTCKLHLVADFSFFRTVGRSHVQTTFYYMLQTITRVDRIYRNTCFGKMGKGFGVQVKKLSVHESYSSPNAGHGLRYNKKPDSGTWNVNKLLTEFSRRNHYGFCLAHLFTYQDFADGVIGLAYVASKSSSFGGICSIPSWDRIGRRYHNCGLTSYVNWGRALTTLEATLVTVHEIGHNFGSFHDPRRCSVKTKDGRYVMYATSVLGDKPNHSRFSECSRSAIGGVLMGRRFCLQSKEQTRCGNHIVEKGEECDPGNQNTKCCVNCKLTPGSQCSDSNSICCKDCRIVTRDSKQCRSSYTLECRGETMCDGISPDCPNEAPKLESGICILKSFRRGHCIVGGICRSICAIVGLEMCSCSVGNSSCKVCCKRNDTNRCEPYSGDLAVTDVGLAVTSSGGLAVSDAGLDEHDGVQCDLGGGDEGICENGKCQRLQKKVRDTFKDLLLDFTLDRAIRFMENNIVITILFFSLLLWIPAGCVVSHIDRREDRKMKEKDNMSLYNSLLRPTAGYSFKKGKGFDGGHARVPDIKINSF